MLMIAIGTRIDGNTFYAVKVTKSKTEAQEVRDNFKRGDTGNRVRITGPSFGYYRVLARHVSNKARNEEYKEAEIELVRKGDPWSKKLSDKEWRGTLRYV